MNINKHNVAMRWITRRRTNEVAGLYESFPGTFSAYQEALSSGFQGTMEEFIQHQSIPQSDRPLTGKIDSSDEQQVAGRPKGWFGTQGTYSAPEELSPMPNIQDLIREEGVQVGPQVKDGGRIYDTRKYFKPGGLVEPGVTHYGRIDTRKEIKVPGKEYIYKRTGGKKITYRAKIEVTIPGEKINQGTGTFNTLKDAEKARDDLFKTLSKKHNIPVEDIVDKGKARERTFRLELPKEKKNYISSTEFQKRFNLPEQTVTGSFSKNTRGGQLIQQYLDPIKIGKGSNATWFLKPPGKEETRILKKWFTNPDPYLMDYTKDNVVKFFKQYESMLKGGNYPRPENLPKWISKGEAGTAVHRIAQILNGQQFDDFNPNIKVNKSAAQKIFKKLSSEAWGTAYSDADKAIKMQIITKGIGKKYFGDNKYSYWKTEARKILKDANISEEVLARLDINELTGMSSAADNKTFASSQFVNLMDNEFNRKQHANMIKQYGIHEGRLQKELLKKNGNPQQVIKNWEKWRNNWFKNLNPKYQTKQIKSILPSFVLGEDAASKMFTAKRLEEFRKMNFPIAEEIKAQGYGKTFATSKTAASKVPLLGEIKAGDQKAIATIIEALGCPVKKAAGGRVGFADGKNCFAKGLQVIQTKNITSDAQARNIVKLSKAPKSLLTKLLGPYGVGLDVVFEAGMIGTDVLKGKPLNEAVADNWIAGSVYKTFTGKTGENLFNERLAKMDSSTKLYGDAMNLGSELEDLTKKLAYQEKDIGTARSQITKEDIAKTKAEIAKKTKEFNTLTKDGTLIEPGTPAYESYHSAATELRDKDRATSPYSKYLGPTVSREDFESDRYQLREKVEPTLPVNYSTFKPDLPTRGDVNTVFQDLGLVQPISGKVPEEYADELITQEKWRQLMEQPGMKGTQEKFFNTGGRVGFKVGGIDKGRRAFMKWLAGITGAGIATGTGLIKWGKVAGKGKTVIKAGDHIIQGTSGMPDWYIPLINRIVKEGDDVTKKLGTVEREIVHTKKINEFEEVTVYRNMDTGNVRVEYGPRLLDDQGKVIRASNDSEVVHLEYKAGEVIDEGKHAGKKTDPEFSAAEAKPRVTNWEGDIEWEHMDIDKNVDDLLTDTSKLKTFAKKKLTHKDKVIAKKKQKYKTKLEKDPSEQLEYIEKKEGATIDDLLDEGKAVGEFDSKGYDTHNLWKGMNLPTKKIKKASGGSVDYDNYLPDIEDIG